MTLNDYYYDTVAKQHAAELQAVAAQDRLAKIARQANKKRRADQREARRLQATVHGRRGPWEALRALFVPEQPATDGREPATTDQGQETTADKPVAAASR